MNDVTLGKIIDGPAQRDAIHMAVAPVISGQFDSHGGELKPGELVCLGENGLALKAFSRRDAHGIVDPFLEKPVKNGEKFWMVLFQKTITDIRHHWRHPAFPEPTSDSAELSICKKTVEEIATANDMSYEKLMEYADLYLATGKVSDHMNASEDLEDNSGRRRLEDFWKCYKAIRGVEGSGEFLVCCY